MSLEKNKIKTFIIPCKYNGAVFNCVESIKQHYPDDSEIIVVDSDSEDKTYFDKLEEMGVIVINIRNKNYITGAIWYAYKYFKRDRYYIIHDSIIIKGRLDDKVKSKATSIRYFNSGNQLRDWIPGDSGKLGFGFDNEVQRQWALEQLRKYTNYHIPDTFVGTMGSTLICDIEVLDKLKQAGFNNIVPCNKNEDMGMERLWGIALQYEGYDIKSNTICGNHCDNPTTDLIEKIFYTRK